MRGESPYSLTPMPQTIEAELAELKSHSLLRKLRQFDSPQQPAMATGKQLVNFSSNDYLGLATEPGLKEAAKKAIDEYGVGAGASRLVCGTLTPHVQWRSGWQSISGRRRR